MFSGGINQSIKNFIQVSDGCFVRRVVLKSESTCVGAARRGVTSKFLLFACAKTFALKAARLCFECHSLVKEQSIQLLLVWLLVTFEANEVRPGFPDHTRESRCSARLMELFGQISAELGGMRNNARSNQKANAVPFKRQFE